MSYFPRQTDDKQIRRFSYLYFHLLLYYSDEKQFNYRFFLAMTKTLPNERFFTLLLSLKSPLR